MRLSCHRLFKDVDYGCTSHTYINVCLPNYCRLCPLYEPTEYGGYPWSRVHEILQLVRFGELNVQGWPIYFLFSKEKKLHFLFHIVNVSFGLCNIRMIWWQRLLSYIKSFLQKCKCFGVLAHIFIH